MTGTSGTPIPCPLKSSAIFTHDRVLSLRGSTVMFALGLIGPATPRAAQLVGGLISVISWVIVRSVRPIWRVVVNLEPTLGGRLPSRRTLSTSCCHSANWGGSGTYQKTSSGGRSISMLCTIGGIVPPPRDVSHRRGFVRHYYNDG